MSRPNIEIRHLRYFLAVAEDMSFRRAALRLHVSQPPLTRQVQQLEEELGVELFARKGRGIELTPAGEMLFVEARKILDLTAQAIEKAQLAGRGDVGRLDVGVFGSAVLDVIPKLITAFRDAHPGVSIVMHDLNKAEQLKALRDGRLTVGFNRFVRDEPDIVKECVLREHLLIACSKTNPLSMKDEISIEDLQRQPLVLYPRLPRPGFADKVVAFCRSRGFEPHVVQEVDDVVTAVALVSSGFGLCVVAESATTLQLPNVCYRPLEKTPDTWVELYCQYLRDDRSPILKAFLEIIRSRHALLHD